MTAFHITLIAVILFIVIFCIMIYQEGLPDDFVEWIASITLSIMIEMIVIMGGALIGAIIYGLLHVDWYGFFHDKVFLLW